MKFLLSLVSCVVIAYGCKPVNRGSQAKVDDSGNHETVKNLEKIGQAGTKLFNVTNLTKKSGDQTIIIPIAISLEIKNKNIVDRAFFDVFMFVTGKIGSSVDYGDTKIIITIKDLRHAHSRDSVQKLTLRHDGLWYSGGNKHGKYKLELHNPLTKDSNLNKRLRIGQLHFRPKKTKGIYYEAPLVHRSASAEEWTTTFTQGRFYYSSEWLDAIHITEDMFHIMQGKNKSPTLPANSEFKRNCLDKGLLEKQKEGKIIYYQQGLRLSRDDQSNFRIYGLNELLTSGVVGVDSLDCYKSSEKGGLFHVLYDNVFPHLALPPSTHGEEKIETIYISNRIRKLDTFHSIIVSDRYFRLEVAKSRIPAPSN